MHRTQLAIVSILGLCAAYGITDASAQTSFTARRITIGGTHDIDATAINNRDEIVAAVFDDSGNVQSGVILRGRTVTTLPPPYHGSDAPMPQAINDRGDVLGYAYEGIQPHMFLRHGNSYASNADVTLVIEQQQGPPPLPIGLNHRDAVFYTIITGQQNPTRPIFGKLPHVHGMPYLMRYQTAHRLNAHGMLSGTTFYGASSEVFVGSGRSFIELLPPNAVTSSGGYVNDAGEVAGIYTDSANTQHGFTWSGGTYTSFDLPEAAKAYSASVTGINNAGRVVGTYTSQASGRSHAFLYNGTTVTAFGDDDAADTLSVTLNDAGTILESRQDASSGRHESFRVTCKGTGC